jgi:hypothetical protein
MLHQATSTSPLSSADAQGDDITVACYYFGNYHPSDPRNESLRGAGWTEWELVKSARPRFPAHEQPKVPLWGYEDESDPKVMARKIDAAADHGIDAFIFDWYHYNDGLFLERPLEEGFMAADNNDRLRFGLMWANHDWVDIHPYKRGAPAELLYPGAVTPATFDKVCDLVIERYFTHPSYWLVEGCPYFSFYDLSQLLAGFDSPARTRAALDEFREKTRRAGFPDLHLNAVVWGKPVLPGEVVIDNVPRLIDGLGFDSVTSYVWIHHIDLPDLQTDFDRARDSYFAHWDTVKEQFRQPYYPNVTMGWDSSPRAHQEDEFGNFGYPFTNTISGNTPDRFRRALELTKERLRHEPAAHRILNINSWNEWTEGSYLEPDTTNGMAYLEAVRDVFVPAQRGATVCV